MPELAGNFREHFSVLRIDAVEILVFERDSASGVAASRICFEVGLKELIPTKGCQISNAHACSPMKDAAARSLCAQPVIDVVLN